MSHVPLGQITSTPNGNGEHTLKCPFCKATFLSIIEADLRVACAQCGYQDMAKAFIAKAHQNEVERMAQSYVKTELGKTLQKAFKGNKNIKFKVR